MFGKKSQLWLEVTPRDDLRAELEPAAEHATLGSWRLGVGGQLLTAGRQLQTAEGEPAEIGAVEDVPLIDLAVWLADSWSHLVFGRPPPMAWRVGDEALVTAERLEQRWYDATPTQQDRLREWAEHHALTFSATDFAVPDVVFRRVDAGIEVSWRPQSSSELFGVAFNPPAGARVVSAKCLTELISGLVEWVTDRCAEDGVHDVRLTRLRRWSDRDTAVALRVDSWLDQLVSGGAEWLRRWEADAIADLKQLGESPACAFGFLRSAQAMEDIDALDAVWCRLRSELSGRDMRAALSAAAQGIQVGLDPQAPWKSGYELAQQVRPRLQRLLGMSNTQQRAFDVAAVFGHWEIPVVDTEGLSTAVQGAALVDERGRVAVLVHRGSMLGQTDSGRKAILAHELCHLLFDRSATGTLGQVDLRRDLARSKLLEQRANAFAAELLLPRAAVRAHASGRSISRTALRRLAREYGAGMQLAAYHAENLGLQVEAR